MRIGMEMKGQASYFIKIILIVISAGLFVFIVFQYYSFVSQTVEEKESSKFRVSVLNILQKLVTDDNCLTYGTNKESLKPVLDINKIKKFSTDYKDLEPECAKALDFDYNIKIVQLEKKFQTYPGEKLVEGECEPKNGIAVHVKDDAYLFVCDRDLSDEDVRKKCCSGWELDGNFPRNLNCVGGLSVYCKSYDCKKFIKPEEECENIDESSTEKVCCIRKTCNDHPWILECYNINPESDCTPVQITIHAWCGNVGTSKRVPVGVTVNIKTEQQIWGFAISSGTSSFSPEKAKREEIELSLPVTIRHNETFSTEGIIYIKAVRGELEEFYSILEDVCDKAKLNEDMKISKYFKFSYPVEKSGNKICMLNSCKIFSCPYTLDFNKLESGEYVLEISFDSNTGEIKVRE